MNWRKIRNLNLLDYAIILGAIVSFTLYGIQAYRLEETTALGQKLGKLTAGKTLRKMLGNSSFNSISPESPIYNRDVLWVQESPWIEIRFGDGSVLRVRQGSLIVISRSLNAGNEGSKIEIIEGEIQFDRHWHWPWESANYEFLVNGHKVGDSIQNAHVEIKAEEPKDAEKVPPPPPPQASPIPTASDSSLPMESPSPSPLAIPSTTAPSPTSSPSPPAPSPSASSSESLPTLDASAPIPRGISVHPKPGSILLKIKGHRATVLFTWSQAVNGSLSIQHENGNASAVALQNAKSVKIDLEVDHTYQWSLNDSSGKSVLGPFNFRLLSSATHPLGSLMKDAEKTQIEMVP